MARKSKPKNAVKAHVATVVKSATTFTWASQERSLIKPVFEVLKNRKTFTLDDISRAITASKLKRTVGNVVSVWTRYGLIQEAK